MLRLKRVELQGFKSFCERTELRFNGDGITAIVGPNGCGKSNLGDAISWVLGEQSAKTLRGARMEDVIFAGTRDRKPLGMAAVTMTLVDPAQNGNPNGDLPQAVREAHPPEKPGEITITRRLFRSGESEYLINGRAARLRDIQDIFMGTGLGPESYAIIEQGRIGQILSSKPQDRRAVIEEAAGITKYKTRRRLAEAKLESAKQNLARVFDILEEVSRQVNSLKRQASKARRYEELRAELDSKLRIVLHSRYQLLEREAAKTALDLNLASAELRALSGKAAEAEREHEGIQAACYQKEAQLTETRKQLSELNVEAERMRGRLENQTSQGAAIEQRIAQGEAESAELATRLARLEAEREAHRISVAKLDRETELARQRVMERNNAREELQRQIRERERELEAGRLAVLRLLGEASILKNQLAQIEEYLAAIDRETERVQREEQTAAADLERLSAASKEASERIANRQLELGSISGDRRQAEQQLAAHKSLSAQLRHTMDELRAEFSRLKARKDSLEEILSQRAYTTEAVKRLFGAIEEGRVRDFRPVGVLADFVEVEACYERAAEEFLHDELEYVVVENWRDAKRGIELMRTDVEGRATFLVYSDGAPAAGPVVAPEAGIVARLSDQLRLTNGLKDRVEDLLPRLARCFLVKDHKSAQRLALEHPQLYFLMPDGVCYHGQALSGGKKAGSGPLALKRELRELSALVRSKQQELDSKTIQLANLDGEIALLEQEVERLRSAQQAQEKDVLALEHEARKIAEELSGVNSRLSVARLDLERLRQESGRTIAQRERNQQTIEEKESALRQQEQALEAERENLERLSAEVARVAEEHAASRVELAGLEERSRSEHKALARLENELEELAARRREIASEIEAWGTERACLLADNVELERKAALLAQQALETEHAVNQLASEETRMRAVITSGEENLKLMRAQMQQAQENRSRVEVELVKLQAELKYLDETSRKELNCPIAELASSDNLVALDTEGLARAEQQYQEIKAQIDALGPVNPQALQEYQESQQRYEFLNAQRQDLLDSIRDTEKAIREIDQVSRQKFTSAFGAINANFRQAFETLFGGGTGEMRLTDETNLAESGIDIVASPPGKKLQNVLLLSGGEKALTALALLMAIFRYQPSPFCVLDEVDAPLDEPNIERLTRLLKEMSQETQFIVITHSRKTMEATEAMYGVTMPEPGVSKLVSVRLAAAPEPVAVS